jgi:hypothetical protein
MGLRYLYFLTDWLRYYKNFNLPFLYVLRVVFDNVSKFYYNLVLAIRESNIQVDQFDVKHELWLVFLKLCLLSHVCE